MLHTSISIEAACEIRSYIDAAVRTESKLSDLFPILKIGDVKEDCATLAVELDAHALINES
jgi:hypothetical protein